MSQREFTTYAELLRKCYVVENSLKKVQEERDRNRIGQKDRGRLSHQFRPRPQSFKGKQVQNVRPTPPHVCYRCNKNHYGSCVVGGMRYYQCQRVGHMTRGYPHNKTQMQGKCTSWVYTLDARNVKGNNVLIVGTCHVNDHPYFLLFYYGIPHYFVSIQYMELLGLKAIHLSHPMVETTSMDTIVETPLICEDYSLPVNGRVL